MRLPSVRTHLLLLLMGLGLTCCVICASCGPKAESAQGASNGNAPNLTVQEMQPTQVAGSATGADSLTTQAAGFEATGNPFLDSLRALYAANPPKEEDFLLIPYVRVGRIMAGMTKGDIINIYGKAKLKDGWMHAYMEGDSLPCTYLYPNTANEIALFFRESTGKSPEQQVIESAWLVGAANGRSFKTKPRWHTLENLTLGSTMAQLVKANQGPVFTSGFGYCGEGSLGPQEGLLVTRYNFGLGFNGYPAVEVIPDGLMGEGSRSSDDPDVQAADIRVEAVFVTLWRESQ